MKQMRWIIGKMFLATKRFLIKLQKGRDRNLREKLFGVNFSNESDSFMLITRSERHIESSSMMFIDLYLLPAFSFMRQELYRAVLIFPSLNEARSYQILFHH